MSSDGPPPGSAAAFRCGVWLQPGQEPAGAVLRAVLASSPEGPARAGFPQAGSPRAGSARAGLLRAGSREAGPRQPAPPGGAAGWGRAERQRRLSPGEGGWRQPVARGYRVQDGSAQQRPRRRLARRPVSKGTAPADSLQALPGTAGRAQRPVPVRQAAQGRRLGQVWEHQAARARPAGWATLAELAGEAARLVHRAQL
jgi:hypothetical protein